MKKILFFTVCLFLFCCLGFAQSSKNSFKLTGFVEDSTSSLGLKGVNIVILSRQDNKNIGGTSTDEKGNFTVDGIKEKVVKVRFSCLGYQGKVVDSLDLEIVSRLGYIRLRPTTYEMPEIVIKTIKPMVEFHVDKQVINMDQVPGGSNTLTDALKSTGLVQVDPQSNAITIRGQAVKIEMDGQPYDVPDNMLANLPAAIADQVELILAPSAKESAEGGTYILNIVSKKSVLDSYSGSVHGNMGENGQKSGGLDLHYKSGKFAAFGSAFGWHFQQTSSIISENVNYKSTSFYRQYSLGTNNGHYNGNYYKVGFDYNFDDNNSVTFYTNYSRYFGNNKNYYNTEVENSSLIKEYDYYRDEANTYEYASNNFYGFYKRKFDKKGEELTVDALFTKISTPNSSGQYYDYSNKEYPQIHNSSNGEDAHTFITKIAFADPTDIGKFETGYNFTTRDRNNNYNALDYINQTSSWQDTLNLSNFFKYKENIHAVYLTYSNSWGKYELKTGIRAENLHTHGEQLTTDESFTNDYFNLFPNLNLSYKFNDMFQLAFNAFRRVRYPNMYFVNPFKEYSGVNSYSIGNPTIKPQFINSYGISLSQFINAYYVHSTGNMNYETAIINDSISISSPINISSTDLYGLELSLPYYNSPTSPVHLPDFISSFNINYNYRYQERHGRYYGENLNYNTVSSDLNANLGLKVFYDIDVNFNFMYIPKQNDARSINMEQKFLSMYISKTFFNKKLKLNFSVDDILKSQKWEGWTYGNDFKSYSLYSPTITRRVSFGISYSFNDYTERHDRNIDDGRDSNGNNGQR